MALELRIASPCSEKWESMTGDARARFCAKCKLNVFNIAELTELEVRALLSEREGRVCGRLFRRADGTVLTKDCPTGVALLRRRALAALTMVAALVVALVGYRLGRQRSCPTGENTSWFDRTVGARVIEARESLRATKTLGPVIDELFPSPSRVVMGEVAAVPPGGAP